jgi:hypothetical protein
MVHAAPDDEDISKWLTGEPFMENMVESAKATINHFGNRIVYINVLRNMSVDCDCLGVSAAPTKAHNLGILASTDILAVDQASIDMVYKLPEAELHDLIPAAVHFLFLHIDLWILPLDRRQRPSRVPAFRWTGPAHLARAQHPQSGSAASSDRQTPLGAVPSAPHT